MKLSQFILHLATFLLAAHFNPSFAQGFADQSIEERSSGEGAPIDETFGPDEFEGDEGSETCELLESTGTDVEDLLQLFEFTESNEGQSPSVASGGGLLQRLCPWLKPKKRPSPAIKARCQKLKKDCWQCVQAKWNKDFNKCMVAQCKNPKTYDSGPPYFAPTNNPTFYCKSATTGSYHQCSDRYNKCIADTTGRLSKRPLKKCKVPKMLTWSQACKMVPLTTQSQSAAVE